MYIEFDKDYLRELYGQGHTSDKKHHYQPEIIKGYKGFNPDLTCRGFQYEVGKEYDTDKAVSCETGFHFCENPFDIFNYYAPSNEEGMSRFCEVEGSGDFDKSENDKVACTHIKVNAEIGLQGLITAGIKFIIDKVNWRNSKEYNTGYCSAATNTGNWSAATNTGNWSAATNTGYCSAASVEGKDSIAIVTGKDSKAKGKLGCWIVLTEREDWNGETYPIKEVKAFKVDGEVVKPDTYYKLVGGKAVEIE